MVAGDPTLLETALTGGDDYEILFTAGPRFSPPAGIARIGEIVAGDGPPNLEGWPAGSHGAARLSFGHF
jgi:thiamine-monophosphate kinase